MYEVVEWAIDELPEDRPRHLLGIGDVDDLIRGVELGIDTFDCAMPTRLGRHGMAVVPEPGRALARRPRQGALAATRQEPLMDGCPCPACAAGYTRGYLHYLVKARELTGDAPPHPPQPRLPAAADGRPAGRRSPTGRLAEHAAALRAGAAP